MIVPLEIHVEVCVEKWLAAKCSHFLVITEGNLDHLFSYAAGNGRDQKSDLVLQASCPEGLKKVKGVGGVNLSPPSYTLFCVHLLPHTHTHTVGAHRYTQPCVLYTQTSRQRRKGRRSDTFGRILGELTAQNTLLHCSAVKWFKKGLVTSVCNPLLPSMHYSPGPVGPLCDPLLRERKSERERARRDRGRGRAQRKNREHKMSGCVMSDRNGANLSPGG